MNLDPVIFTDGTEYFKQLENTYRRHSKGLFIMTPSGAGKTYYCKHQEEPHWIDGDDLWIETGAQPDPATAWWDKGVDVINRVEQRCDAITAQAMDYGFWVLGSVNYWFKPDAIVIPDWDVLWNQIKQRQYSGEYDGGMTDKHQAQLKKHLEIIEKWHTDEGVPKFDSVQAAVEALTKDLL